MTEFDGHFRSTAGSGRRWPKSLRTVTEMIEVNPRCPNADGKRRSWPKYWRKLSKGAEPGAEDTGSCRISDERCRSKGGRRRKWAKRPSRRGLRSPGLASPVQPLPALPTRLWPLGKAEALGPGPEGTEEWWEKRKRGAVGSARLFLGAGRRNLRRD